MAWKYQSQDNLIEVIVDPDFEGDLLALASARPVWIVDSPQNAPRIDAVWALGAERSLFEVSRCRYQDPTRRITNLLGIMGCLDDHHPRHNIIVHGLQAMDVRDQVEAEGFHISVSAPDGFLAVQDTAVRDRLLGRT